MIRRLPLLAGVSLLALAGGAALAQQSGDGQGEAEPALTLGAITVTGTQDPTAPVKGYVATTSATATKSATPILTTPASVAVITADQIRDQGAQSLGQALDYTAGVVGEPFGADPRFDSPSLRGFDMRDAQYLNGLRLMRPDGAPSYDIYGLERVEVLKGPASVLYGSGSPAGVINMVQKHAQPADRTEIGLGFGSFGSRKAFFDTNKAVNDDFAYRLTGVLSHDRDQIQDITNDRGYLGVALRWQPTQRTTLNVLASYQKDSPISPAGLPYALTGQGNDRALRGFYAGDPGLDDSDRRMLNLGYALHHDFDNGWSLDQAARFQTFDWDYTGFYVSGLTGTEIDRGVIYQDEDTSTITVDTRLSGKVTTGALAHALTFGLDARRYDEDTTTQFATSDAVDVTDPMGGAAVVGAPWYTLRNDLVLRQLGLYAQDEMTLGRWHPSLAVRHDWTDQKGTITTNGTAARADQSDSATTYRAGLSYLFDNGVAPYLSYATSFDPVVGADIDGNALQPTKGRQWEAGVKYSPAGYNAFFSAAVFDLSQSNVSTTVTEGGITGTRQLGKVNSRGVELQGTAEVAKGWKLRAAYTYTNAEQIGANDGDQPANTPRNAASLWVDYSFPTSSRLTGLSLGGGVRYIGGRFGDNANVYRMKPVTLVDLGLRYALSERATAALSVSNLTDKVYVSNCGSFGCYYGEGRALNAKLTYSW